MFAKTIGVSIALVASVGHAAEPSGAQLAEMLANAAQRHLGVQDTKPSLKETHAEQTEVQYEDRSGKRFVTSYIDNDGKLRELILNGPDAEHYTPLVKRRDLISKMIEITVPDSSETERAWAAEQLDGTWTRRMRPLPVQVGDYVFRGMTVSGATGTHDTLWILAAYTGATGLKYPARP